MLAAGTGLRVLLCPVVMALVLSRSYDAAAIVFVVAAATDWFDGRLARRWGVTTRLGAFLALRAGGESGGPRFETSMLGKWKATVQFVAITLAILRPDVMMLHAYLDQWAMVIAAIVTAWSGIDYVVQFSAALRS